MFELFNLLLSILTMGANTTNKVVSAFLKIKRKKIEQSDRKKWKRISNTKQQQVISENYAKVIEMQ